ncbi:hypothetical protein PTNB73_06941 [Pyrenophora teres f. teres]|nr:hypothetical protein HRS9122_10035 [Pyrenophora teres f. teres]KAE8863734.1 hypothetical protein PTNB73_06941 [Pyrenophora teres f. teres]
MATSPNGHGSSALLPPLSVIQAWPAPNYEDPVTRSKAAMIVSIILGTVMLAVVAARLWARIFIQRRVGADDWLIIAALFPTIALTISVCLATEYFSINRHVWDVPITLYIPERKITFIIYLLYVVSGGLIKTSILLFYRRLDNRCITRSFRIATWVNIVAIIVFIVAFTVVLLTACAPTEAFWLQFDPFRQLTGYEYSCWVDEGAYILSASVISAVQDGVAAFLPTLLYWNLKIARRQKLALGTIFALGYVVCAVAGVRSFYIWKVFSDDLYDSTWLSWPVWLLTVIEVQLGMICASAPALKLGVSELDWSVVSATKGSQEAILEEEEAILKEEGARCMVDVEQAIVLKEKKMESTERMEVMETKDSIHPRLDIHSAGIPAAPYTQNQEFTPSEESSTPIQSNKVSGKKPTHRDKDDTTEY